MRSLPLDSLFTPNNRILSSTSPSPFVRQSPPPSAALKSNTPPPKVPNPSFLSPPPLMAKAAAFLLLLFLFALSIAEEEPPAAISALDRQQAQLDRLEALLESLSKTVSALESSLSRRPQLRASPSDRSPAVAVAVAKHKHSWSDRFAFTAAAQLESSPPHAAAVLPYEDPDGTSKYFAVGDSAGKVLVFSSAGDFLLEIPPGDSASPVTALLSYPVFPRRNDSLLFVAHADGSIAAHRLSEPSLSLPPADEWAPPSLTLVSSKPFVRGPRELGSPPVLILEPHQAGRNRYIVASDAGGRIRVFTESGTLYGTAIASSKPLAFMKQRLLFLTEAGAGSLDLRSMAVRETQCEGLNGSLAKSYTFDGWERSKAYGFTVGGDLIHVVLLGDVGNLKCRVRSIRKAEVEGAVAIQSIKGYLLAMNSEKVFVYNVSSQYYGRVGAPRPLISATLQEIKSVFLDVDVVGDELSTGKPFIAADREKLVVLGLGGGYIGIYRSNFPVFKVESNAVVWSGPALLFLLFLIGIWQFYVKKKDSLGWTPEESFNASGPAASSSLLGTAASDRGYTDASRTSDIRDMRGSGLRGPPRRYVSPPSRYPGGTGIPFRPASGDSGFRGNVDLKYRGQNIDNAVFPNRREPLFSNSQVIDDHVD